MHWECYVRGGAVALRIVKKIHDGMDARECVCNSKDVQPSAGVQLHWMNAKNILIDT